MWKRELIFWHHKKKVANFALFHRKSYGYRLQRPVEEKSAPDTKYQFDYIVQEPEKNSDEKIERTYSGRVDRVTDQKKGKPTNRFQFGAYRLISNF